MAQTKETASQQNRNRILIIDDDPFVRDMFYKTLISEDYEVFVASNGEEGLFQLEICHPKVIILDLKMPKMGGVDFLEKIKAGTDSPFSIIVVTGLASEELIRKCYELNIHAFLRKPVNIYEIRGIVRRSLETIHFYEKLKEELLLKEQAFELLKTTFDSIVEGCITFDSNLRIETVSQKACDILGQEENKIIGKPISKVLGSGFAGPEGILFEYLESKKPLENHVTRFLTSFEMIPVTVSLRQMRHTRKEDKWLLVFQDLRSEEKLLQKKTGGMFFGSMVSCDPKMKKLFQLIDQVALSNANVIVEGASGTGKELVAREIHLRSKRSQGPFHAVNCAAISSSLLESEFFGHEKGAFTGANYTKIGRFELAHGGTLFLDEVGEILPELQGKLLRAIQEQTFERVGSTKPTKVNVRIIAATNKNLKSLVEQNRFREDLYYRLHVVRLHIPPLKERLHDIPLLVNRFIEEFNDKEDRRIQGISSEALERLFRHDWPGNVRELRHVIEYAYAISKGDSIHSRHLQEELQAATTPEPETPNPVLLDEKTRIVQALKQTNYHKQKASALLGMHRSTFYRKLRKYGLEQV